METTLISDANIQSKVPPSSTWDSDFLERHDLYGYAYRRTQDKAYYPYWKTQHNRNTAIRSELKKLGEKLEVEPFQVIVLKGASLIGDLYQDWGERFVADVELLISYNDLWKFTDILKSDGYRPVSKLGQTSKHRHTHRFAKRSNDIQINIDVHTELFWHSRLNFDQQAQPFQIKGFFQLNPEIQLVHLCGSLSHEDQFASLSSLMDIYKYVERYKGRIDWPLFWKQAQKAKLFTSAFFSLFLCQKLGLKVQLILYKAPKKQLFNLYFLKKLVDYSFLYAPTKYPTRQRLISWLLHDRF